MLQAVVPVLRLISLEPLIIKATEGGATWAAAYRTFNFVDASLKNREIDKPSKPTSEISVWAYELIRDANLAEAFASLSPDEIRKLCLTTAQVECFARDHSNKIRGGSGGNFCLSGGDDDIPLYIVNVRGVDSSFGVYKEEYGWKIPKSANYHHQLIAPQLVKI